MLWTGAYLCCACAGLLSLNNGRTLALGAATCVIVLVANILRACALFYIESGMIQAPAVAHDAVGIVMFAFAAGSLALLSQRLADVRHAC
jgi:exosortase/archaeosortase family protein